MNIYATKSYNSIKNIFQINYYASLLVTLGIAIMSLSNDQSTFNINSDLYGPLANNLKFMLVYLVFAEFSVFFYCFMKQSYKELTILGLFLILLIGALEFYGHVNEIPIDENYYWFFLYTGISHILYGNLSFSPKNRS